MATITRNLGPGLIFLGLATAFSLTAVHALPVTSPAQGQTSTAAPVASITATSANVAETGIEVKINILRWSGDEQRNQLIAVLKSPPVVPPAGDGGGGERGGRGSRGNAPAPPTDPFVALAAAIGKTPTIGYLWTNEPVGYAIKYAYRASTSDGGERIVLATDRRLAWTPAAPATDYPFTLFEMRLDRDGAGEGKTSVTTKVIVDEQARTIALENYDAAPTILRKVSVR